MKPRSIEERWSAGKELRRDVPRAAHAAWTLGSAARDPVEIIERSSEGRLAELIPMRYGRMLGSPFTFLRGAAALMAHDLANTPRTGLEVQVCGDCHLLNFGMFATPERNLIFDVRDFDETLRAAWEWDLKRLAASFVVAGRLNGLGEPPLKEVSAALSQSYRLHMRDYARMSPLEVWYERVSADDLIAMAPDEASRKRREKMALKARARVGEHLFPRIVEEVAGRHQFVEQPPITTRMVDDKCAEQVRVGTDQYRSTLSDDRRFVFDRYQLEDFALRVVGIGSVGTRCYAALLFCDDKHPLLLQVKEARRSVLEPYAQPSPFDNQGQRVVAGQRLVQAASDMFLGWLRSYSGHDFYVRQLRDMKYVVPADGLPAGQLQQYAEICGWTLARAHARSGDPAAIAGYLGSGEAFDLALAEFASAYADQNEQDYVRICEAVKSGRLEAAAEEDR